MNWPKHDVEIEVYSFSRGAYLWYICTDDDLYLCRDGQFRGTAIPRNASHEPEDIVKNPSTGYYASEREAVDHCKRFGFTYIIRGQSHIPIREEESDAKASEEPKEAVRGNANPGQVHQHPGGNEGSPD